jgi:hypothetical protein
MMDRPAGRRQLDLLVRAANALEHNRIPPPIREAELRTAASGAGKLNKKEYENETLQPCGHGRSWPRAKPIPWILYLSPVYSQPCEC